MTSPEDRPVMGRPAAGRPLVDACRPRTSLGCLFSDTEVASLRAWMASGATGPALATAGPGSGLTTLVALLVAETGLEGVWVGCATPRVKAALAQMGASPVAVTLRRKIIVIDEVDAMGSSGGETSSLSEALAFVKTKPPLPVLFLGHATRSQKPLEFAKAWPRFAFGRPGAPRLAAYLADVAAKHGIAAASDEWVRDLASRARGDVRAALNAMDMLRHAPAGAAAAPPPDIKDDCIEGLDLTEAVLRGEAGRGVRECLRMYAMEPAVLPMGMWENYLSTLGKEDIRAVAAAADGFADADRIDRFVYSRQAWDLQEAYGASAVAVPAMSLARHRRSKPPKTVSVTKFGSVWSKMYNACAKVKHVRSLALAYAEAGAQPLSACELAWVRRCLQCAIKRGDKEDIRRACWPLAAPDVLHLARLDAGPGGSAWYTQAVHGRVKAALADGPRA